MESHIRIRNLEAFYGEMQALKNVNLEIPRHEITVIMGPSGCGKTTLLKKPEPLPGIDRRDENQR